MRFPLKTLALVAAVFTVSACESMGDVDTAPPYAPERTAQHTQAPAPAPVVEAPAPAPVVQQCDYAPLQSRVSTLEEELRLCREGASRVREAFKDELKK